MMHRACCLLILISSAAWGQTRPNTATKLTNVFSSAIDDIFLNVPETFRPLFRSLAGPNLNFASFNSGVAVELSNLPASSSASAVRFVFDPGPGTYVPVTQSLGPLLSERAATIGKDRVFLGFTYQRFRFTKQDDVDLGQLNLSFLIATSPTSSTIAEASASANLTISQMTAHITYGVTPWLDASYAFPILSNSLDFQINGRTRTSAGLISDLGSGFARATSTGLGDGVARLKAKILERNGLAIALATDTRLPIGNEFNFQGAGAFGVKPFLIAEYTAKGISPHINAGYQWNGKSFLASPAATEKLKLPAQAFYTAGVDVGISKRATVAFDVLDQIVLNGQRIRYRTQTIGTEVLRSFEYPRSTRHEVNGAAGFKVTLREDLVLTGNLLFRLNSAGLRAPVVPLIGLSYLF